MGSKATHQFPTLDELEPTDLFYVVREESPGVFKDYSAPRSLLPDQTYSTARVFTSAELLAIQDIPIELVPAPTTEQIIVVKMVTMAALGGTVAYDGMVAIGGNALDTANFLIEVSLPDLDRPEPYHVIYPMSIGGSVSQGLQPGEALRLGATGVNPIDGDGDVLVRVFYLLIPA